MATGDSHVSSPLCIICGDIATKNKQPKQKLWGTLDIRNTLGVLSSPSAPRWDHVFAEKQAQGSHWFSVMVSFIFYALYICFYAGLMILFHHIYPPHLEGWSLKILSYKKLVHGAKKVGDRCFRSKTISILWCCLYVCFLFSLMRNRVHLTMKYKKSNTDKFVPPAWAKKKWYLQRWKRSG